MAIVRNQNRRCMQHTEFTIQKLLVRIYMSGAKYMVPNMYCTLGEMDMFLLRRSGYAEEFEIKVSTADLRADFKKCRKHQIMLNQYTAAIEPKHGPNRFSYVISDNVNMQGIKFPAYVGLYCVRNDKLVCLQLPKLIHKRKWDWHRRVAGSCSHRLLRAYKLRY